MLVIFLYLEFARSGGQEAAASFGTRGSGGSATWGKSPRPLPKPENKAGGPHHSQLMR
jgi:hypothetical protein